jgi:phage shock protein PspC (stress-responsive transcriptional regulator)
MDGGVITKWVGGIIGFVVLFLVVAALMPSLQTAGNNISGGNYFGPMSSLFNSGGVIFIVIGAALVLIVIYFFMGKMKHK